MLVYLPTPYLARVLRGLVRSPCRGGGNTLGRPSNGRSADMAMEGH